MDWGLVLIFAVLLAIGALGFWLRLSSPWSTSRAQQLPDGSQEARIVVARGYWPSRIELQADVPATLRFDRADDDACTELLVSELWPTAHRLRAHGETAVRFTPHQPGRYDFTCGMGMYSGQLIIRARAA